MRVLDFGCYDGYILRRLSKLAKITGVGVDIAPAAIALARRLPDGDGLEFVQLDGVHLPFASASFDVAICSEILEHVPDIDDVLAEISRVLISGGRLYATMPNALRDVWRPLHPLCREIDQVEGHVRRMSRGEFLASLASHGFKPLRVRYRGFVLSAIWYRNLIYSPRTKEWGLGLIGAQRSPVERLALRVAHSAMRGYMYGDRLFSRSRRCMAMDAALMKL
jgi:SAM-dependent methyltransferase